MWNSHTRKKQFCQQKTAVLGKRQFYIRNLNILIF